MKYGKLTVMHLDHRDKHGNGMYLCKCDCGNEKTLRLTHVKNGSIRSCGCFLAESTGKRASKHKLSHTRVYSIWKAMKRRCEDSKDISFKNYGGKGIKVCEEWQDVHSFYDWAIKNNYSDSLTIDRIDGSGDYEPSNCRWATMAEQNNNKDNVLKFEYEGEIKTLRQLCDEHGKDKALVYNRLKKGLPLKEALTKEVKKR